MARSPRPRRARNPRPTREAAPEATVVETPHTTAAAASIESARPSEVVRMIAQRDFDTLVRRVRSIKSQTSELSGTRSDLVMKAVETKHLDRKAFNIFMTLLALKDKPEQLATTLMCLDHYIEIGGLAAIANQQAELALGRPEIEQPQPEAPSPEPQPAIQPPARATVETPEGVRSLN